MGIRQSASLGYRNRPSPRVVQRSKLLQILVILVYVILYLLLFAPRAEHFDILISILCVSTIALWFGPVSLIGGNDNRKAYDPATLFNFAVFYYVVKGVPFAWNVKPAFLSIMTFEDISHVFSQVTVYMVLGLLAWNWAYHRAMSRQLLRPLRGSIDEEESLSSGQTFTHAGVVLLGLVGAFSFFMLVDSTGGDITLFIRQPWLLAYLGTSTFGVRSSLGFLWVYGTYMLPLAALMWLAISGSQGRIPGLAWWIFAIVSIVVLLLFSPRAIVVSFIISVLVVYHLAVTRIRPYVLLTFGLFAVVFSYMINIWRSITRTVSLQGIVEGIGIIIGRAEIGEALRFLGGTDLSDIRVFTLISHTYGNALSLKYGGTLLRIFYQVIPRAIWSDKPLGLGYEIGLLFGSNYSGVPPGFFGEMYMNFHIFGVVFGGLILGFGLAALYREWITKGTGIVGIVLYAILVPRILLLPSSTIANLVISTAILFLGAILAFRISAKYRGRIER
jgi:hypothetical protein